MRARLLLAAAIVLALSATGSAHHSFFSYYHEDQINSYSGQLVRLRLISPHSWVHIEVRSNDGTPRTYEAEWVSAVRLARTQFDKDTLKIGDQIVITASPARDPESNHIHLKTIERPSDGWRWVGRRPDNTR